VKTRSRRFGPVGVVGVIGTVALAMGAFSLSFTSLMHLALRSGIDPSQAWEWPLIVDGMIIVATVGVVARAGRPGTKYAWLLLVCGALTSAAGNALQAARLPTQEPTWIAVGVATIPPVVLLASTHMTVILTRRDETAPGQDEARPVVDVGLPTSAASVRLSLSPPGEPVIPVMPKPEPGTPATPHGAVQPVGDRARTYKTGKALSLRDAGLSVAEIAQAMDVSTGSVRRYLKPSPPTDQTTGEPE
jgi:hypothetical protein